MSGARNSNSVSTIKYLSLSVFIYSKKRGHPAQIVAKNGGMIDFP